ncbi:unnamed protein product [Adineta ricciae]|uniref:ubiquitinyl hydrolase 1 n=2 Tax=Adineta ricciae TaxID=249248 RepID=A0A815RWA2_ADIRI|nr:unnamed protein product [Adineta ricciae]
MFQRQISNDLTIYEPIQNGILSADVTIGIRLRDQNGTVRSAHLTLSLSEPIVNVITKFLRVLEIENIRVDDVSLSKICSGSTERDFTTNPRLTTLNELKIKQNDILWFMLLIGPATSQLLQLNLFRHDPPHHAIYDCDKNTTTLKMLFDYVIEAFELKSMDREQIHLITIESIELNHGEDSNKLLIELGVIHNSWVFVETIESRSRLKPTIHVLCAHTNGDLPLEVPFTTTVKQLKDAIEKQLKDRILIDFTLFNRMHEKISFTDPKQNLYDFGVKPGQIIYATLHLAFSGDPLSLTNTRNDSTTKSLSLISKQQSNDVTPSYEESTSFDPISVKVSVDGTVDDAIKKLKLPHEGNLRGQLQLSCGSTCFTNDEPYRCLSSYNIQPGDVVHVKRPRMTPVRLSDKNDSLFSTSSLRMSISDTPIGLSNLVNTCYMNSALQCLAHTMPLTQFFLNGLTQNNSDGEKTMDSDWNQFYTIGSVTGSYADVIRNLWIPNKRFSSLYSRTFRPDHIKETIGNLAPRFATSDQQDAQEFLLFLIDEMHKEMKKDIGDDSNSIIEELFFGTIESTIICTECKHAVKTTNPFSILPLPLVQSGRRFHLTFIEKNGKTDTMTIHVPENGHVKDLLEAYIESRPLYCFFYRIILMTDDDQLDLQTPLCELTVDNVVLVEQDDFTGSEPYKQYNKRTKQLTLDGCLREFCSIEKLEDSWLCEQESCRKHTEATKQLQFSRLPQILIIQLKRFSHKDGVREKIETFVEYPIQELDLSSFSPSSSEAIYELFAIIKHTGSIYGGHYIAYAQHEANGKSTWYEFNDSLVSSFCLKDHIVSKDAYLLFYSRREKTNQ